MSSREIAGRRAIVTGASSGIGRALALELARQGAKLVLVARRRDRLEQAVAEITTRGGEATCVAGDITDTATRRAVLDKAAAVYGGLDMLVNNAGIGASGPFADSDGSRVRKLMEVNFFAAAELIHAALPLLKQGTEPIIVNVGSILGHRGVPRRSEYCASKFALQGFSEALRAELAAERIDLLIVSPGPTDTEFFENLPDASRDPWGDPARMPPSRVAALTVRAIRRGQHEIIPTTRGRLLCWLNRLSPRLADWVLARYA